MRIVLVNQIFDGGGGITTYATELIRCLCKKYDLTVILPDDSYFPIKESGVKVLYHDPLNLSKTNALFFIKLINDELKPDVVIASYALIIPIIAPFLNNNIRVMTVSHSGKYIASEYSVFNYRYLDNIIAASSEYNKQYLEKKYHIKDKSKIKVVYNSVSSNSELENLRFEKKKSDIISIVYSGGGLPGKNPDLVLKILCKLLKTNLNFKFYWTGGSRLPLPRNLVRYCKLNDVKQFLYEDERVVFMGRIPSSEDFVKFVSSANILLTPSRNEGCSMLVLQALRSGSILIVGDYLHSNKELVEKGKCGFSINHRSPEAFADKLVDIISRQKDYLQLYENSHRTFEQLLSYPVWEEAMEALINEPSNHTTRKKNISNICIMYYIFIMKTMRIISYYKSLLNLTIRSLLNFYIQYFKMKISGEFPLKPITKGVPEYR